jgi:hypothetical protein
MVQPERFPYVLTDPALGEASLLPFMPITLESGGRRLQVNALVDSGSAVNVLPYDIGLALGAVWDQQSIAVRLTGNLANEPARALLVSGIVGRLAPIQLAFAWTRSNAVPAILGQVNFFIEFDVHFYRSRGIFEVEPKSA